MKTGYLKYMFVFAICVFVKSYAYGIDPNFLLDGIYYHVIASNRTAIIAKYPDAEGDLVIPDNIYYNTQNIKVIGIGEGAFLENEKITSISCQEPKEIGARAFKSCKNLRSIQVPCKFDGKIPEETFCKCEKLEYIAPFQGVISEIGKYAFQGCRSIKKFTIPGTVSYIDLRAFYDFYAEYLTFENGEKELKVLTSNFTGGVIYAAGTIYWNRGKTNSDSYGIYASELIIGETAEITTMQFYGLKKVISLLKDPASTSFDFSASTYMNAPLYVPKGCLETYQNSSGWWRSFFVMQEMGEEEMNIISGVKQVKASQNYKTIYGIGGEKKEALSKGLNIIRNSNGESKKVIMK